MAQLGSCRSDIQGVVNDAVCITIELADTAGTPLTIWENDTTFIINGTIMVENNGSVGPTAELFVNGTAITGFTLAPGEARSITMNDIISIGIDGTGTGTTDVKVSFSLNYKF